MDGHETTVQKDHDSGTMGEVKFG